MMHAMECDEWPELKTMLRGPSSDQALVYINSYLGVRVMVADAYKERLAYEATMSRWPNPEEWDKHEELSQAYKRLSRYEYRILSELAVVTTPLEFFR